MVQTAKLQGKMKEAGHTLDTLSAALKLSKTGFFNKVHGKRQFLCSEMQIIRRELSLSDEDFNQIFFAPDVD